MRRILLKDVAAGATSRVGGGVNVGFIRRERGVGFKLFVQSLKPTVYVFLYGVRHRFQ